MIFGRVGSNKVKSKTNYFYSEDLKNNNFTPFSELTISVKRCGNPGRQVDNSKATC